MAITVTAAQGGTGTSDGLTLTVKVLTGAAGAQSGATASSSTVTTAELAITPDATGSWVYGALVNGDATAVFTAAANTTFSQNQYGGGLAFGTFRGTGTTTPGTPVTLGSTTTAPTGDLFIALAEILAAGTLAEDASSPAGVSTITATTVSTAAFTPPPGSLLVAMAASSYAGSGTLTMSLSDSSHLAWVQLSGETVSLASVWVAQVPPVPPAALLIPPSPFTPMAWQRQSWPSSAPLLVTQAETGTGTDSATAGQRVSDSDAGTGTDAGTPGPVAADTGAGAEAGTVTATVPGADSGSGTDSGTAIVPAASQDTGTGTDSGSVTVRPVLKVRWLAPDKLNKSGGTMHP